MSTHEGRPDTLNPVAWLAWYRRWRDVIRAPYSVIVVALLAVVACSITGSLGFTTSDHSAWVNGVAAIITAVAALAESRHARSAWVDHEVRIRVMESSHIQMRTGATDDE